MILKIRLKKSENRSYDNLGTGRRLNLGSSRRIHEDDDNHYDTSEHGNEKQTQVNKEDSDPLFPDYPPSDLDSPSRREESTQKVPFPFYVICEDFLSSILFTIIYIS